MKIIDYILIVCIDSYDFWKSIAQAVKNSKDIYEGDILCYSFGGGVDTYLIERNPDDNQLHARYLYIAGNNCDYLAEVPTSSSVIIGNMCENPEIMEGNDE